MKMRTASVVGLLAALVACNMIFSSCRGPQGVQPAPNIGEIENDPDRQARIAADPLSGASPLSVQFNLSVFHTAYRDIRADWLKKLEVNYDDGTGWVDVTSGFLSLPKPVFEHIYLNAGVFKPSLRATYWDDEIVYNSPGQAVITVLPPEGA